LLQAEGLFLNEWGLFKEWIIDHVATSTCTDSQINPELPYQISHLTFSEKYESEQYLKIFSHLKYSITSIRITASSKDKTSDQISKLIALIPDEADRLKVKQIDFSSLEINETSMQALSSHFPQIESLNFRSCQINSPIESWIHNIELNLQQINLNGCTGVTDASVKALAKNCPNLQQIYLNGCTGVTDASVKALAENCPNLAWINFDGCTRVTDAPVKALAENCPKLQTIGLNGCTRVTDASVKPLAEKCPNLQRIGLNGCTGVTDASVKPLAKKCPNLQQIYLNGCTRVTDASVKALAENCPNLQRIGARNTRVVEDYRAHPRLRRILKL